VGPRLSDQRVVDMVDQMDHEGFGGCTNMGECRAVCPKETSLDFIAMMNGDLWKAALKGVTPSQKR